MASQTTDFSALLGPIAGNKPAGLALRGSEESATAADYEKLKESHKKVQELAAMMEADRRFESTEGLEGKEANWTAVKRRAVEILSSYSKDLEVAVWLVRALVKLEGFAGLRNGLEFLNLFLAKWWEGLYPTDHDLRRGRIEWLDEPIDGDLRAIGLPKESAELTAANPVIRASKLALEALLATLAVKYGDSAPKLLNVREAIDWLAERTSAVSAPEPADIPDTADEEPQTAAAPTKTAPTRGEAPSGTPRNRQEALRMLEVVAEYFSATEPLSPVPHLLRRAARWAQDSLQAWLQEMVVNEAARQEIYKTLDMKEPPKPE